MAVRPIDKTSPSRARVPFRRYLDLLITYLRPQKALVAVVAVSLLINIGLQLANPQLLRYFIDEARSGSPVGRLVAVAILFTGVALVQQVFNVIATYTSGRVGWTATNALRGDARSFTLRQWDGWRLPTIWHKAAFWSCCSTASVLVSWARSARSAAAS